MMFIQVLSQRRPAGRNPYVLNPLEQAGLLGLEQGGQDHLSGLSSPGRERDVDSRSKGEGVIDLEEDKKLYLKCRWCSCCLVASPPRPYLSAVAVVAAAAAAAAAVALLPVFFLEPKMGTCLDQERGQPPLLECRELPGLPPEEGVGEDHEPLLPAPAVQQLRKEVVH